MHIISNNPALYFTAGGLAAAIGSVLIKKTTTVALNAIQNCIEKKYLTALNQHAISLDSIPSIFRSKGVCMFAVAQNGLNLKYVPDSQKTPEVCTAALNQSLDAFDFVPDSQKTPEMRMFLEEMYLSNLTNNTISFDSIPYYFRNEAIWLYGINNRKVKLNEIIPVSRRTEQVCLAAVRQNGLALQYIDDEKITREIYLAAVRQNGLALKYVPEKMRTEQVYLAAVTQNGQALQYIPEEMRTLALCIIAIKNSNIPCEWSWIPKKREILAPLYVHDPATIGELITTHFNEQRKEILTAAIDLFLTKDQWGHVVNDGKKAYINAGIDHRDPSIGDFLLKEFLAHPELDLEEGFKHFGKKHDKILLPLFIALTYGVEPKQFLSKINFAKHETTIKLLLSFMKEMEDRQCLKEQKAALFLHVFDEQLEKCTAMGKSKTHLIEHAWLKEESKHGVRTILREEAKHQIEQNQKILNLRLSLFKMITAANKWELFQESEDFSTEGIKRLLIEDLIKNGFIDASIENAKGLFLDKFLNFRIPGAIFSYAGHFSQDQKMIEPIKQFISGVMKGTFLDDRHAANSHRSSLSQEQLAIWEESTSNPLEAQIQKEQSFNPKKFLEDKLVQDDHEPRLKGFFERIENPVETKEDPSSIQEALKSLYFANQETQIARIENLLKELKEDGKYEGSQFVLDLKDQLALFNRSKSGFKNLVIHDTEDPQDLLLSGTEVFGSCQNIAGNPLLNKCLMGYVLDGKVRLLAIKNSEGKIEARGILKLLVDEKDEPVLFLETLYPDNQFESQIRQLAKQKADLMNVPLFVMGQGKILYSKGCIAPYEYEDAVFGVTDGKYEIRGTEYKR